MSKLVPATTAEGSEIEVIEAPAELRARFGGLTDAGLTVSVVAPCNLTNAKRAAFGLEPIE